MNFKSQTCKGNSSIVPQKKEYCGLNLKPPIQPLVSPHSLAWETTLSGSETLEDNYMTN